MPSGGRFARPAISCSPTNNERRVSRAFVFLAVSLQSDINSGRRRPDLQSAGSVRCSGFVSSRQTWLWFRVGCWERPGSWSDRSAKAPRPRMPSFPTPTVFRPRGKRRRRHPVRMATQPSGSGLENTTTTGT